MFLQTEFLFVSQFFSKSQNDKNNDLKMDGTRCFINVRDLSQSKEKVTITKVKNSNTPTHKTKLIIKKTQKIDFFFFFFSPYPESSKALVCSLGLHVQEVRQAGQFVFLDAVKHNAGQSGLGQPHLRLLQKASDPEIENCY